MIAMADDKPAPLAPDDRTLCLLTADLLSQGRLVNRLSFGLTLASLIALPLAGLGPRALPVAVCATIAVPGLLQLWLAARIALDAAWFRRWAEDADSPPDLEGFDAALVRLGLAPHPSPPRPIAARAAGALRLLRLQAIAAVIQVAAVATGGVCLMLLS
jgi:hypothetical protein